MTTTSDVNNAQIRRRSIKIKDETAIVNVTIWNEKVRLNSMKNPMYIKT